MYPETDIPLIPVSHEDLQRLSKQVPQPWENQVSSFSGKHGLPLQLGEAIYDSEKKELFEKCTSEYQIISKDRCKRVE